MHAAWRVRSLSLSSLLGNVPSSLVLLSFVGGAGLWGWGVMSDAIRRNMPSSRFLFKFEDHLRLPTLTITGSVIGHKGIDPRRLLWWTWLAIPWSPSARTVVTNILAVIARAPPPRYAQDVGGSYVFFSHHHNPSVFWHIQVLLTF